MKDSFPVISKGVHESLTITKMESKLHQENFGPPLGKKKGLRCAQ